MKQRQLAILAVVGAGLFTFLFYREGLGLNLLIFEWFVLTITASRVFKQKNFVGLIAFFSLFLSSLFVVLTHSVFSHSMNMITFLFYTGSLALPQLKTVFAGVLNGMVTIFNSQAKFFQSFRAKTENSNSFLYKIRRLRFYIIPIVLLLVFIGFYRNSNPTFEKWVSVIQAYLPSLDWLEEINIVAVLVFILGLFICNGVLFPVALNEVAKLEREADDSIHRKRKRPFVNFKNLGLKNEYQSALFLFGGLNVLILVLNLMDINSVWFNFSWEGSALKEFVHEGTLFLITSILISIIIVLYYFRNNLNFYSKNIWLKRLAIIWLIQNAFLCVSVIIRNLWYIKYFSLAHLRIGLFIFLAITIVGLITVMLKVKYKKSFFYLFRLNSLAGFIILLLCSFVDWDIVIANYNVSQKKSFYHLSFMCTLSDKTLPVVDIDMNQLQAFEHYNESEYSLRYVRMSPEDYLNKIESRKKDFIEEWESSSWKSWNYADSWAYSNLEWE